jgi:hypothetical protein
MNMTIKAILARCNGNEWKAIQYCCGVAKTATNPNIVREYEQLAVAIRLQMTDFKFKAEAAHV